MLDAMSTLEPRNRRSRAEQRAETRERLLESATTLFARQGITGTSVEEIADAAGYTRGAFYSNFRDKDELVLELLDRHVERNVEQLTETFEQDRSGALLVQRLTEESADRSDAALHRVVLNLEFWLYAVRNPANRERLAELQRTNLRAVVEIVDGQAAQLDLAMPFPAEHAAKIVTALADGLAFHALLDPESYPPDTFAETLANLQRSVTALAREQQRGDRAARPARRSRSGGD
jgi:AcrR family transcriptional regulator